MSGIKSFGGGALSATKGDIEELSKKLDLVLGSVLRVEAAANVIINAQTMLLEDVSNGTATQMEHYTSAYQSFQNELDQLRSKLGLPLEVLPGRERA